VTKSGRRAAFTMIELIFAIVLIAITVAAIPQMLSSNAKGTEQLLKQETIAATAGEAFRILTFPWDDNSMDDTNRTFVLDATAPGSDNLSRTSAASRIRAGMIPPAKGTGASAGDVSRYYHRLFYNDVTAPASGQLSGIAHVDASLLSETGADAYKNATTLNVVGRYVGDGNAASNFTFSTAGSATATNLKMAELHAQSGGTDILVLRVYSANIGSPIYFTRDDI